MAEEFKLFGVRVNATAPDTFRSLVPTERAAESIVRLDVERVNGAILVVDAAGEHFV
jgi:hypothetical protein